jgi:hypothetical protein
MSAEWADLMRQLTQWDLDGSTYERVKEDLTRQISERARRAYPWLPQHILVIQIQKHTSRKLLAVVRGTECQHEECLEARIWPSIVQTAREVKVLKAYQDPKDPDGANLEVVQSQQKKDFCYFKAAISSNLQLAIPYDLYVRLAASKEPIPHPTFQWVNRPRLGIGMLSPTDSVGLTELDRMVEKEPLPK